MATIIFLLAGAGLLLLIIELFIPGGLLGVVGGAMMVVSVVLSFTHLGFQKGAVMLLLLGFASIILFFVWLQVFPKTAAGRALTLGGSVGSLPAAMEGLQPGMAGNAMTALRPGGTVRCEGRMLEATSEGEFIDVGTAVQIVRVESDKVIVRVLAVADGQKTPPGI